MSGEDDLPSPAEILKVIRESGRGPLKPKDLVRELGVGTKVYSSFKDVLAGLEGDGRVCRVKGGRYAVPEKINLVVGRLSLIRSGDGFVAHERGKSQDVYVPFGDLASAMNGDQVVARIEGAAARAQPGGPDHQGLGACSSAHRGDLPAHEAPRVRRSPRARHAT